MDVLSDSGGEHCHEGKDSEHEETHAAAKSVDFCSCSGDSADFGAGSEEQSDDYGRSMAPNQLAMMDDE